MRKFTGIAVALGAALAIAGSGLLRAQDEKPRISAKQQFEMIKGLAGEWHSKAGFESAHVTDGTVRYRVTSGGSTVMEVLFEGTEHEMVTMYHLEGENLLLTHYCALGNQPRMKAQPSSDSKKIAFKFAGGANIDPAKDTHMHDANFDFVGEDQVKTEWVLYREGKPVERATFDLKRKKK